ncbi:MAG: heme-binding protein [Hyphomicrobiales bacterium]|nr:MAG: heme-binding protein [Hyphomicrobiales bacterium]
MAVEEPKFQIVKSDGDFELRDYPALSVAEVTVGGDRKAASSEGFRLLASYIFGGNAGSSKIAMTAPVVQSPVKGRKIAMTAPVTLAGEEGRWTVQFTMPSEYAIEDLPAPNDKRVQLKSMPASRIAVLKFSGLTGDERVASQTERLEAELRDHKLSPIGKPSLARYDPPWTLWFLRRNELMVSVSTA